MKLIQKKFLLKRVEILVQELTFVNSGKIIVYYNM
jgi:hypothetical protein